jgi:hypothetical protein
MTTPTIDWADCSSSTFCSEEEVDAAVVEEVDAAVVEEVDAAVVEVDAVEEEVDAVEEVDAEVKKVKDAVVNVKNESYPLFLIISRRTLPSIRNEIDKYVLTLRKQGLKVHVGPMRVVRRGKNDTDRTLVMMDPQIYQAMVKDGLKWNSSSHRVDRKDFKIKPFVLSPKLPHRNQRALKVLLPKALDIDGCFDRLDNHLQEMIRFDVLREDGYQLAIPFESRENNKHIGSGYIVFGDEVGVLDMVVTHLTISETLWVNPQGHPIKGEGRFLSCYWSRLTVNDIDMSPADRAKRAKRRNPTSSSRDRPYVSRRTHHVQHNSSDRRSQYHRSPVRDQGHPSSKDRPSVSKDRSVMHDRPSIERVMQPTPNFSAPPRAIPPKVDLSKLPFMKG